MIDFENLTFRFRSLESKLQIPKIRILFVKVSW